MPVAAPSTRWFLPAAGLLLVALIISFWIDVDNVVQGGAIDLRNRITGARLMSAGIDPYTYKWTRADSELYCDVYNNPHVAVSKTTSSPAMLAFTLPWATLPYRNGQLLWFATQWALLLGAGWLGWRACREPWQRTFLGALVFLFTLTAAWRLHAERGQSYVLLTFLGTLWLAGTLRPSHRWSFASGFAAALLAAMRPPCLLLLPPLAWKRRDQIPGMAAGLAVGVILPMLFLGSIWTDYFHGMQQQAHDYLHVVNPRPGPQSFPPMIENMPTLKMAFFVPIAYADGSVHFLLTKFGFDVDSAPGVFLFAAVPFVAWAIWAAIRLDLPRAVLGLAAWMYLLDLFLPAYRNNYNDVLALPVIFLGLILAPRWWAPYISTALALAIGLWVYVTSPEIWWQIDLPALLLAVSAVLYLFTPRRLVLDTITASRQNDSC